MHVLYSWTMQDYLLISLMNRNLLLNERKNENFPLVYKVTAIIQIVRLYYNIWIIMIIIVIIFFLFEEITVIFRLPIYINTTSVSW